jgi:hypothetical protein
MSKMTPLKVGFHVAVVAFGLLATQRDGCVGLGTGCVWVVRKRI